MQPDETIVDLQSRLAFQEDALEQLNRVVAAQQRRIDALEAELARVAQQVRSLAPSPADEPGAEPPPHY